MGERRTSRTGMATRDRIIDAALATVRDEGLVGASARAIARRGGFNQALVFYHFGSVEELLLAALERANDRRVERFRERLEATDSLEDLVQVALELHGDGCGADHLALSAIVAGWSARSELGPRIMEILAPWDEMITAALERSLDSTPLAHIVACSDLARVLSALFLGIELFSQLEVDQARTRSLFDCLHGTARLVDPAVR